MDIFGYFVRVSIFIRVLMNNSQLKLTIILSNLLKTVTKHSLWYDNNEVNFVRKLFEIFDQKVAYSRLMWSGHEIIYSLFFFSKKCKFSTKFSHTMFTGSASRMLIWRFSTSSWKPSMVRLIMRILSTLAPAVFSSKQLKKGSSTNISRTSDRLLAVWTRSSIWSRITLSPTTPVRSEKSSRPSPV